MGGEGSQGSLWTALHLEEVRFSRLPRDGGWAPVLQGQRLPPKCMGRSAHVLASCHLAWVPESSNTLKN